MFVHFDELANQLGKSLGIKVLYSNVSSETHESEDKLGIVQQQKPD